MALRVQAFSRAAKDSFNVGNWHLRDPRRDRGLRPILWRHAFALLSREKLRAFFKVFCSNVCVDLCCGDKAVAKVFLNLPNVSGLPHQLKTNRVPQSMW